MATGTGKTWTALYIMKQLLEEGKIDQVIVTAYGNDLLTQWYRSLLECFADIGVYRWYEDFNEFARFQLRLASKGILLVTRDGPRLCRCLENLERRVGEQRIRERTLLVFDEIHGMGSEQLRVQLKEKIRPYTYRLGLSATPVREYDPEGTAFIEEEVGPVIYRFMLEDAIRTGILCEFSYVPLLYELTDEEKKKKQQLIAVFEARRKRGELLSEEELYRHLSRVNKTAVNKIGLLRDYLRRHPEILERCIIFVETKEYGLEVQKMLLEYTYHFHTYYGEDDNVNLRRFAEGQLECLITCRKISEGVDIRSVRNIVLFSSDRGKLTTTQRIGRSLRRDPKEPDKRACVVDFICESGSDTAADQNRRQWLETLSQVRRDRL